ncbi:MAG: hypothetical protein RMM51_02840 [Verrucomicrobiae bacterium]|nr:hypothetical protein [Verrucomicrobiae bacterium]
MTVPKQSGRRSVALAIFNGFHAVTAMEHPMSRCNAGARAWLRGPARGRELRTIGCFGFGDRGAGFGLVIGERGI